MREPRTVIIIDYCKFHQHYHPFSVSEDKLLEGEAYPIYLDIASSDDMYEKSFLLMHRKRKNLIDTKVRMYE